MIDRHANSKWVMPEPLSPSYDPWDPYYSYQQLGAYALTSVEFTVTNLCNMRCEHCAVGDALTMTEGPRLPLSTLIERLDQVESLQTISITGGEPSFSAHTVHEYILPLLQYAHRRGLRTQINCNLTLDLSRYEAMAPYLDVMHISYNYLGADDFYQIGFANADRAVPRAVADQLYENMMRNAQELSRQGMFISAESMINYRTHMHLEEIHRAVVEMGCKRHEVHPMYPSAFASKLPMLSQEQMREAIHRLLDVRKPELWMLFGTLPFFRCNDLEADQRLLRRLASEPNVTVRNDPDGRNRLNVNCFTGAVYVTDFAELPPLGQLAVDSLEDVFQRWRSHPMNTRIDCFCKEAACCGPNLLVADMYYKDVDFRQRRAIP